MNEGGYHNIQSKLRQGAMGALALLATSAALVSTSVAQEEVFSAVNAVALGTHPMSSFDISFVDKVTGKYYLGDRANNAIDVLPLNTTTPTVTHIGEGQFTGATGNNDTSGPDGVMTANNHTEIWAGNGDSTVRIYSTSGTFIQAVATGNALTDKRADELCEDPVHHLALVANNAADPPFATLINTGTSGVANKTVAAKLIFDGTHANTKFVKATNGAEQCQWSPITGAFYLNLPEVNGPGNNTAPGATVAIDPVSMKVTQVFTIPISLCAGPQGMALGPNRQIALGCGLGPTTGPGSVVINASSGFVLFNLPGLWGNDEVWFNPDDQHYFFAAGNHVPARLSIVDAASGAVDQNVSEGAGSHSVAANGNPALVYVPIRAGRVGFCSQFGIADSLGCLQILKANIPEDE
jgi:hypothetical protein